MYRPSFLLYQLTVDTEDISRQTVFEFIKNLDIKKDF